MGNDNSKPIIMKKEQLRRSNCSTMKNDMEIVATGRTLWPGNSSDRKKNINGDLLYAEGVEGEVEGGAEGAEGVEGGVEGGAEGVEGEVEGGANQGAHA